MSRGTGELTAVEAQGIAARMASQGLSRSAGEWDRAAATLAALTAEVQRLRGVVEQAYHEGWEAGLGSQRRWPQSKAFAALTPPAADTEDKDADPSV